MSRSDGKVETMPSGVAASFLGVDANGRPVLGDNLYVKGSGNGIRLNAYFSATWKAQAAGWGKVITNTSDGRLLFAGSSAAAAAADDALSIGNHMMLDSNGYLGVGYTTTGIAYRVQVLGTIGASAGLDLGVAGGGISKGQGTIRAGSDLVFEALDGSAVFKYSTGEAVQIGGIADRFLLDIDTVSGQGRIQTKLPGNTLAIRNANTDVGAANIDSAITFRDNSSAHTDNGKEYGAIGYQSQGSAPFTGRYFIEASNDPQTPAGQAPGELVIVQTGQLAGSYGPKARQLFDNTGKITFFGIDGSTAQLTLPAEGGVKHRVYTVATLPAAATVGPGTRAFVSDANATTFASTVAGGGANTVPVYSDGTNWKIG